MILGSCWGWQSPSLSRRSTFNRHTVGSGVLRSGVAIWNWVQLGPTVSDSTNILCPQLWSSEPTRSYLGLCCHRNRFPCLPTGWSIFHTPITAPLSRGLSTSTTSQFSRSVSLSPFRSCKFCSRVRSWPAASAYSPCGQCRSVSCPPRCWSLLGSFVWDTHSPPIAYRITPEVHRSVWITPRSTMRCFLATFSASPTLRSSLKSPAGNLISALSAGYFTQLNANSQCSGYLCWWKSLPWRTSLCPRVR